MGITQLSSPTPRKSVSCPLLEVSFLSPSRSLSRASWGTLHPHPLSRVKLVSRKSGFSPCFSGLNNCFSTPSLFASILTSSMSCVVCSKFSLFTSPHFSLFGSVGWRTGYSKFCSIDVCICRVSSSSLVFGRSCARHCGYEIEKMAEEGSILDLVLKYGLFLGALFQLACIVAIIVFPTSKVKELEEPMTMYQPGGNSGTAQKTMKQKRPKDINKARKRR